MQITLEKRKDGSVVLRLKRNDGTSDWQKQQGPNAAFFPLHDLTHYAVETELGIGDAFYGLVAAGWTIAETGEGKRPGMPANALFVENVVGTLDTERASGSRSTRTSAAKGRQARAGSRSKSARSSASRARH